MVNPPVVFKPLTCALSDHQYASKHGVPLWLRVFPAPARADGDSGRGRPWMFWTHGGGYVAGEHWRPRAWLLELLHARGIHLVACAYRLAPVVGLAQMLEDCCDAFRWCQTNLAGVLDGVDVDRYCVAGDSAGGTLATLLALELAPAPAVVFNLYGVTDFAVSQHKSDAQAPPADAWPNADVSEDDARAYMAERNPAKAVAATTNAWNTRDVPEEARARGSDGIAGALKTIWRVSDAEWSHGAHTRLQWAAKDYAGRAGLMVSSVLRLDELASDAERDARMRKYSATARLDDVQAYPPTVIMHGTGDSAVPVEESYEFGKKLKSLGGPVLELYPPGEDHVWDEKYQVRAPHVYRTVLLTCWYRRRVSRTGTSGSSL
jgi:acetyl esterase/lipase